MVIFLEKIKADWPPTESFPAMLASIGATTEYSRALGRQVRLEHAQSLPILEIRSL